MLNMSWPAGSTGWGWWACGDRPSKQNPREETKRQLEYDASRSIDRLLRASTCSYPSQERQNPNVVRRPMAVARLHEQRQCRGNRQLGAVADNSMS